MVKLPFTKKKKAEVKEVNPSFSINRISVPVKKEGEGFIAEDIDKIVDVWLKPEHVDFKTRLTRRQVRGVTKTQSFYEEYDVKCLKILIYNYLRALLSLEGQSSKELVDILKQRISSLIDEKTTISKNDGFGRFFE